jgi:hypothetical protein
MAAFPLGLGPGLPLGVLLGGQPLSLLLLAPPKPVEARFLLPAEAEGLDLVL